MPTVPIVVWEGPPGDTWILKHQPGDESFGQLDSLFDFSSVGGGYIRVRGLVMCTQRSDCFQGRIANREQIQVQIGFPQHQAWVEQFREWWRDGIALWRARSGPDATLVFLCELGPPPSAMTDADQAELSDRWQEALTIRGWVEQTWAELAGPAPA